MLGACEAGEVFALLEGGGGGGAALSALYAAVREPWLVRALLHYHARTGSARAIELLARAPEPHARHLLDALLEQLREPATRRPALHALAPLLARRPAWLHRLPAHPLPRELLRAARLERAPLPLLHALLALAALLPAQPALAQAHWPELADALLRPHALEPPPPAPARDHLLLAQLALFHALYATHPVTLLEVLRAEHAAASGAARDAWQRGLAPLLASVRLHPALVTGSRQREADAARLARLELHDVVAESRRLGASGGGGGGGGGGEEREREPPAAPASPRSPAPGSGAHAARAAVALRPGAEPWFPLAERCGADSAPPTPLPAEPDAGEPPEAAVEATPENTPAKETRAQFRFPGDSGAVRAIGRRSQPPSPLRKETSPLGGAGTDAYGGRLSRVALDRAALERRGPESPVPFGGAPPPAGARVARPEPRGPAPPDAEDREVLELTQRARAEDAWADSEAAAPAQARARALDPRRGRPSPAPARAAPPPRRAASCGPPPRARTAEVAAQTVDAWPEPYEFLIADFYRNLPDFSKENEESASPCARLDNYLSALYSGRAGGQGQTEAGEQLALVHAQLLYERWRREAHAERNRRLLGRCRQVRALELTAAALRDQLRAAGQERDALRARLAREPPPPPPAAEHETRLEQALAGERAARARAEAALREERAARAADRAELTRAKGEAFEAARHVEALARGALAAERRAEQVRRLRRELLVLSEREARLLAAAQGAVRVDAAAAESAAERRLAAERLAAARAEAEAAGARAEAATARAAELEAALAARDAVVGELKRAARASTEEAAARARALQDKYAALLRVARAAEGARLARLAGAPLPAPPPAPAPARAPPAPPPPQEWARVRRLLEADADEPATS